MLEVAYFPLLFYYFSQSTRPVGEESSGKSRASDLEGSWSNQLHFYYLCDCITCVQLAAETCRPVFSFVRAKHYGNILSISVAVSNQFNGKLVPQWRLGTFHYWPLSQQRLWYDHVTWKQYLARVFKLGMATCHVFYCSRRLSLLATSRWAMGIE